LRERLGTRVHHPTNFAVPERPPGAAFCQKEHCQSPILLGFPDAQARLRHGDAGTTLTSSTMTIPSGNRSLGPSRKGMDSSSPPDTTLSRGPSQDATLARAWGKEQRGEGVTRPPLFTGGGRGGKPQYVIDQWMCSCIVVCSSYSSSGRGLFSLCLEKGELGDGEETER